MNLIRKTLIWFFIFSLAWPQASLAIKIGDYPSPVESMNQIMTDLGVDKEELKKNIDSTLNVASLKKPAPDVEIIFVPESPQAGKELTAIANPGNFANDIQKMYFTWFLKHNTSAPESKDAFGRITKHGNTDWNDDGDIDIEDYKIEAARILAKGDWEPDYEGKIDPETRRPIAEMSDDRNENGSLEDERYNRYYEVVRDTDDDDYEASFGGDDQKGKPAHCYIRDIESGIDHEIGRPIPTEENIGQGECAHLFPESDENDEIGDGIFGKSEEKFWGTDPESEDTNNDGIIDEQALTGMGMMSLKWIYKKGDQVGVAVEGVSENTDYKDSSMKTMWAFPRANNGSGTCGIEEAEASPSIPPRGIYTFDAHGSYYCGGTGETCTLTLENCYTQGVIDETETFINPGGTPGQQSYPPCGQQSCPNGRYTGSTISFLWKAGRENPNHELRVILHEDYPDACDVCISPSSNIEDPKDCESLEKRMGQTNEINSSFRTTDLNDCFEDNLIDPAIGTKAEKIEIALSYSPQYPINDKRGQNEALENNSDELRIKADLVNIEDKSFVKYDWKFWLCPGNGENCFPRDNQGVSLPDGMTPQQLLDNLGLVKKSGLGLDSLNLKLQIGSDSALNFAENTYLKVELRAIETTEQTEGKSGKGVVLIPLQETDRDIIPKKINVIENRKPNEDIITQTLTYLDLSRDNRYSNLKTGCPSKTCPVAKNEIIGLEFNGVTHNQSLSWFLNGKSLTASGENSEIVYFPILGGTGFKYSVKLDISEKTKDGKENKFSLARDFLVEEPGVRLEPLDCDPASSNHNCRSIILGTRILNETDIAAAGATEQDFSQDFFQAEEAETITIAPNFNFDKEILRNINDPTNENDDTWQIQWMVDGTAISPQDMEPFPNIDPLTGNLNLPINKSEGEKYTISAEALYTQPDPARRALYKIWNVSPESFYEKKVGDSLEIEVIDLDAPLVQSGTKKILASVFSGMPSYLNFLFRTVLTLALILFMANLSFILFPKQGRYQ